jgi:hypothetical protein
MVRILDDAPKTAPEVKEKIEEEMNEYCSDPNCKICRSKSPINEPVILEKKPEMQPTPTATQPTNPNCPKCGKRIEEIGVRSVILKTLTLTKLGPGNFAEQPIMETFHCNNCGKVLTDNRKEALDMIAVKLPPVVGLK